MTFKGKEDAQGIFAPFNMAIATLMRLDKILQEIKELVYSPYDLGTRQTLLINLVQQFYLNAVPLLPEILPEKFGWILEVKPEEKEILHNTGFTTTSTGNKRLMYNSETELKLNKALQNMQIVLQNNEKLFMPSKRDPKHSWREG